MADEERKEGVGGKPSGRLTKILAGAAGSICVPLVVAVLSKWLDPAFLMPKSPPPSTTTTAEPSPHDKTPSPQDKSSSPPVAQELGGNLITPSLVDHFYSYGWSKAVNDFAKDPKVDPNLFHYIENLPDGSHHPSIHVKPAEKLGFLSTKEEFENYSLHIWWRWGVETKATRANLGRRAGILLHITGPDGGVAGALPQSLIIHLRERYAGNIRLMGPENLIKCQARVKKLPGQPGPVYDRDAPETALASTGYQQGTNQWDGTIFCHDFNRPATENKTKDANKPVTWNRLRIDSDRGRITVYVNNKVINEITGCNQTKGRIGFTTNRAEWYIGKMEVHPLPAQPSATSASSTPASAAPARTEPTRAAKANAASHRKTRSTQ